MQPPFPSATSPSRTPAARVPMRTNSTPDTGRRGAALVIALICLLLVGVLSAALARSALLQHEQVHRNEWQIQAEALAASGLDRALQQRLANPDYTGEAWSPASIGGGDPLGKVLIEILPDSGEAEPRRLVVRVVADVPDDPVHRARVSRTRTVAAQNESSPTP